MPAMKKRNPFLFVLLLSVLAFSGCAKLAHMQELLRLKGYSQEKDRQGILVEKQNKSFERLLSAAKSGALKQYSDDKSIWAAFGRPVFEKKVTIDGATYNVWMYRYSTKFFGSDKVYLYFDPQGYLQIYDFSPGGTMTAVNAASLKKR